MNQLPSTLRAAARWMALGSADVPVMIAHPDWDGEGENKRPAVMLWMHGRTVSKEIDPGRYLRWLRSGIAACAIDLPGHGERYELQLQQPERTLDVVLQMVEEIDIIVEALREMNLFDMNRIGIGGMSAGGMATLVRLCSHHQFSCACVEATSGSWRHQQHRKMFHGCSEAEIAQYDPIEHLDTWREIPLQAIHARHDEWVDYEGQSAFINALKQHYSDPERVELITYEKTGAPYEHAGFGKFAADAKNRQRKFLKRYLLE